MKLTLAEGLYLIALDDEEGRLLSSAEHTIDAGLIAAGIFELALRKKVEIGGGAAVTVVNKEGTGNEFLDDLLKFVEKGSKTLKDHVEFILASYKDIQQDIILMLVNRGIIKRESTKLLWIPVSERMDNANYAFEQEIRDSLRAIAIKGAKAPASLVVLMVLIHYCHMMGEVFQDKDELIDAVKYVKDVTKKNFTTAEMSEALLSLKGYFESIK